MPLDKSNAGDFFQGEAVNGTHELILKGLDGIIQVHLVRKGGLILQKVNRHGVFSIGNHGTGEYDPGSFPSFPVAYLYGCYIQALVIKLADHPAANLLIGFIIEVYKFILQVLSGPCPAFIHHILNMISEVNKLRGHFTFQVNPHKHNTIKVFQDFPGVLRERVFFLRAQIDPEEFHS